MMDTPLPESVLLTTPRLLIEPSPSCPLLLLKPPLLQLLLFPPPLLEPLLSLVLAGWSPFVPELVTTIKDGIAQAEHQTVVVA